MKAFAISDLHIDHLGNGQPGRDKILRYLEPHLCPADVIIIGGDISDSGSVFSKAINAISELYPKVIYCFGNHDYTVRGKNTETTWTKLQRVVDKINAPNAILVNGNSHKLTDNTKVGGTMGAYDFSYSDKYFGRTFESMLHEWDDWYDGRHWRLDGKTYTDIINIENEKLDNLVNKDMCNVIVTHIGPMAWGIPECFHNAKTGFFYFDGQKLLDAMPSGSTWIFGHTHDQKILDLGNVRLLCNPLGYPGEKIFTIPKEEFLFDIA